MGSLPDPSGEFTQPSPPPPSFDEFQRQTSLMTSCTLLWKELSDHFSSIEKDIQKKSEALKRRIRSLDNQTKESLEILKKREVTIDGSVSIALEKVEESEESALNALESKWQEDNAAADGGEVDDAEGLLLKLRSYCTKMDCNGFWKFVTVRKRELESMRAQMPAALSDCIDPSRFVLEAISEVFPVDKSGRGSNDFGWACVMILESLIPVVVDPILGNSRLMVTPKMKERAKEIAETWKASLDERGGIENVKTPDVHTFLQHLVTFGIVKEEDLELYRKLVIASAWRKQMPKLAVSLGLGDKMSELIEELIKRGQHIDAVHFIHAVGLMNKFPPVPLLKAFLKDAKKASLLVQDDPASASSASASPLRKELSALQAVIKCIEEYKLETELPLENLKKRLEQLEKTKNEKKKPAASMAANKRTRGNINGGGMAPPAKAGRSTNAYVSSFPTSPAYVRSPSNPNEHPLSPAVYGNRTSPSSSSNYHPYSSPPLEAVAVGPVQFVGGYMAPAVVNYSPPYGMGVTTTYQPAYYYP
ncbi:FRIGIDA-like protein 4a [Impatiens glandulifera]|uniref:FRIGIDA-like protein 4a n=1 Tax=Impatiens glandulifera TaxID=253017 RepID=UPI001FB0C226|nr:FRIGIDA-like protein 4a [Impatiens glandulifera]